MRGHTSAQVAAKLVDSEIGAMAAVGPIGLPQKLENNNAQKVHAQNVEAFSRI